jgi:ABC-type nitrate/sulfonate/bicarbonate transport system permease component
MGAEILFLAVRSHGLGWVLENGRANSDVAEVIVVMIVMVMIGMTADRLAFSVLERRVHQRFGLAVAE